MAHKRKKTQSCIKCWKCPPHSAMHAFSIPHVCRNPVNSLFVMFRIHRCILCFNPSNVCMGCFCTHYLSKTLKDTFPHSQNTLHTNIYLPPVPFNLPVASAFLEPWLMVWLTVHFNAFVNVTISCTPYKVINVWCLVYIPLTVHPHLEQGRKLCC